MSAEAMRTRLWSSDRERRRQLDQLPSLLHGMSRALRGGSTLHTALLHIADDPSAAGPGLQRAADRVRTGAPVEEEIDRWAADLAHPDADLVRAVINTGAATGSALATSFDRAAASLQERADLQREIAALTAQARASALVLTVAPVLFLLVMATADAAVLSAAFATPGGRLALVIGVLLDLAGWAWMRRLTRAVDS